MKRLIGILICFISIAAYAVDYTPFASQYMVETSIRSVNNASYMSSGSAYTSEVYAVGASGPASAPSPASGPRKAPGTDSSGYDPNNPQFAPLGDALIPLLLMVMAYAAYTLLRRRRSRV